MLAEDIFSRHQVSAVCTLPDAAAPLGGHPPPGFLSWRPVLTAQLCTALSTKGKAIKRKRLEIAIESGR